MNLRTFARQRMAPVLLSMSCLTPGPSSAQANPILVLPPDLAPELAQNINAHVQLTRLGCDEPLPRVRRQLPQARTQLEQALQALGHYRPTYNLQVNPTSEGGCWQLEVSLDPGPQVLLGEVNIQILGDAATQALFAPDLSAANLQSGQPLHHGRYEDLKSALSGRAADEGYFDARFDRSEISVDLATNSAEVNLSFNPGARYHFGEISFSGQGLLDPAMVREMMEVEEGDPYSSSELAALSSRLQASQFFQRVRVNPGLDRTENFAIPVDVDLTLRPRHAWSGGLGFSTDIGPRARVAYENRYVNRWGHTAKGEISLSPVRSQLGGSYAIPLQYEYAQKLELSSGYTVEDTDAYTSRRLVAAATVTNETESGWQQSAFLELQRDDYSVGTERETSLLLMPGLSLGKTRADDLINPRRGWKLFGSVRAASDDFLSDTTLVQLYASAKYIHSLGDLRLLARVESGTTWIDSVADLPASLRYFTGGDQSIRGYGFRELGPLNDDGTEVVGGRNLTVGSVEFDYLVRSNWRVAVFADAGNAFNNPDDFDFMRSVGFGVRWLSPVGPIRIDIAHPFNSDDAFRIHVTMGPDL